MSTQMDNKERVTGIVVLVLVVIITMLMITCGA